MHNKFSNMDIIIKIYMYFKYTLFQTLNKC